MAKKLQSDQNVEASHSELLNPNSPQSGSELVIAFVAAVGVNLTIAEKAVKTRLAYYKYESEDIKITRSVLSKLSAKATSKDQGPDFQRIKLMMDIGNELRKEHGNDILAKGVASEIASRRNGFKEIKPRTAFIIHSLKHPEEVRKLRDIYRGGFHLIGVHAHPEMRRKHLKEVRGISESDAEILMRRDRKEDERCGQQLNETFHLADFFIGWSGDDKVKLAQSTMDFGDFDTTEEPEEYEINAKRVYASVDRFVDIIFGHRYKTPTFGEYAMFMAYSASLRSADLSRQVGAVIARDSEILSTGANDCPVAGGGLYWPRYDTRSSKISDAEAGRDYMRGFDSNASEQNKLTELCT